MEMLFAFADVKGVSKRAPAGVSPVRARQRAGARRWQESGRALFFTLCGFFGFLRKFDTPGDDISRMQAIIARVAACAR